MEPSDNFSAKYLVHYTFMYIEKHDLELQRHKNLIEFQLISSV